MQAPLTTRFTKVDAFSQAQCGGLRKALQNHPVAAPAFSEHPLSGERRRFRKAGVEAHGKVPCTDRSPSLPLLPALHSALRVLRRPLPSERQGPPHIFKTRSQTLSPGCGPGTRPHPQTPLVRLKRIWGPWAIQAIRAGTEKGAGRRASPGRILEITNRVHDPHLGNTRSSNVLRPSPKPEPHPSARPPLSLHDGTRPCR